MGALLQYLLPALVFINAAYAFMPWDLTEKLVGKGGISHQNMTRNTFLILSKKYWPSIPDLTASMIKARETIANANGHVDGDQKRSAKHFDGENFDDGQFVLTGSPVPVHQTFPLDEADFNLLQQIQDFLDDGQGEEARQALGKALHTIQDFYSHSNWVELGNTLPHPGIGRPPPDGLSKMVTGFDHSKNTCTTCAGSLRKPADETTCIANCVYPVLNHGIRALLTKNILLGIGTAVEGVVAKLCADDCQCNDCSHNIITDGLTSGYYHGEDAKPPTGVTKCRHGGYLDNKGADVISVPIIDEVLAGLTGIATGPTEGINKDSLDCGWSSHFSYHLAAVDVALKAGEQFIDDIKAAITKSHDADTAEQHMRLLFGVGPTLAFVVDTTGSMGDVIAAVSSELVSIVNERIGTLSEPANYILTPFNDPADAIPFSTTDATQFEAALSALFAIGGGDCPEPSMAGLLSALSAIDAGSDVFLITDATSKDPELLSDVVSLANSKEIHVYTFLFDSSCSDVGVYSDLALATDGGFFPLERDEAGLITQQVDFWLQPDLTPVASFTGTDFLMRKFRRGVSTFDIPVDASVSVLQFVVEGTAISAAVQRPDGSTAKTGDVGVTITTLSSAMFISINTPPTGTFTMTITGSSNFTLDVFARSPIHFSFAFASYVGRPDHSGWGPDPNIIPTPGVDIPALAKLDGGTFSNVTFQIRSATGTILTDNLPLIQGSGDLGQPGQDTFFGFVNLPPVSCLIYVTGLDSSEKEFMRVYPILFIPSLSAGNVTNATSSISSPMPPNSTALSASIPKPTSTSERLGKSTNPRSSSPAIHSYVNVSHVPASSRRTTDITTVITKTIVKPCPYIVTTVEGTLTNTVSTHSESTIFLTVKSILPCEVCEGPNYGGPRSATGISSEASAEPSQGSEEIGVTCEGSPKPFKAPTRTDTAVIGTGAVGQGTSTSVYKSTGLSSTGTVVFTGGAGVNDLDGMTLSCGIVAIVFGFIFI
jgi:hypothetical protein